MGRTRTHEIHLRLDDKEYDKLKKNAAKCNLKQQTYIRKLIKEVVPRECPSADFWTLYQNLRHMSRDLNELAWQARQKGIIDWNTYWTEAKKFEGELVKILHAVTFPEWVIREMKGDNF